MAENTYEGLFILDSNKYAQNQAAVSGRVDELIEACGGTIKVSRFWDDRRLAYQIDKHRKGTYWLAYFTLDTQKLVKLNRDFHLCEEVIRSLILKIHPKLVDTIVSHAADASAPPPLEEAGRRRTTHMRSEPATKPEGKTEGKTEGKPEAETAAPATAK